MIYTSITQGYDHPRDDVKVFSEYNKFKDPCLNAKIYKVLPHYFMPDEDYWVWIDGNLTLKVDESELISLLGDSDIAVFENPYRETVAEEIKELKKLELDTEYNLNFHKLEGKLPACYLIIRRNTPEIQKMNEKWWSLITTGSRRDQISFPSCYPDAHYLDKVHPFDNKYFSRVGHKIKKRA